MGYEITCPEGTFEVPWRRQQTVRMRDLRIVRMAPTPGADETDDISIDDRSRNVLAVTEECNLAWLVEAADIERSKFTHDRLYPLDDRLVTLGSGHQQFFEVSLDTGAIRDSWDWKAFKVGGEIRELGSVSDVVYHEGKEIISAGDRLYAFEDGEPCWAREDVYNWSFERDGETLFVTDSVQLHERVTYELDTETGELPPEADTGILLDDWP